MKRSVLGCSLVVVGLALSVSACASATGESGEASEAALADPGALHGFHAMPLQSQSSAARSEAATPDPNATPVRLTYYGGPIIPNVKVYAVYWGSTVAFQSHLNDFYTQIPNSSYMDMLTEYNTPTQQIGHGSFGGATVITPSHTGTRLQDADIQAELSAQMDAGHIPPSDGVNNLYMIHFPPGVAIVAPDGQSESCVQFCAYHGTYKKGSTLVYYGIHPDLAQSGCNQGCGTSSPQENTTSVASHEMVEAITDAEVGLATQVGMPLAWYNTQQGEIGDICNGKQGHVGAFTVQLQWSNRQNKCTATAQ
jgi:hypothetical protein